MPVSINGNTGVITGLAVGGLPDGIVDADMLAANSVASGKIASDAITSAKIASGAITSAKLASGVGGKILQVKQTFKNDTASTSSGSFSDISGLTVSITPSATSNKILYKGSLYLAYTGAEGNFRLKRTIGGTTTEIGNASVVDDDADGTFAIGGSSLYLTANFEFLDSPNTTSAITYGIKWHMHSGTMYLNRTWDNNWFHGVSSITAMEVSA